MSIPALELVEEATPGAFAWVLCPVYAVSSPAGHYNCTGHGAGLGLGAWKAGGCCLLEAG